MNVDRLLGHYERIADAPEAISRLRRFTLDLAVRGKLVEQNPNDEPASELLKRVAAEKARLVKTKRIKKLEVDPIGEKVAPFSVPSLWQWTRLGTVGDWGAGSTPSRGNPDLYGGGLTWLKSGELNDNTQLRGSGETVTELAVQKGSFRINCPGDVLIAMYGATIGKLAILAEKAVTNQAVCGCTPFEGVFNKYLFLFLLSQRKGFYATSEGGAQPNISKAKIVGWPISLPPLAEQHRIVSKVDELMALCDRLEAARTEREATRNRLSASSLARLDAPDPDPATFRDHAAFALENLAPLTTRTDQIKALRQTILNLAVRGKLVEQDPIEGTGQALLFELRKIRNTWETSGRVRKQKVKNAVADDEQYLDLPTSWAWTRLIDVGQTQTGTSPSSAITELFGDFMPFVKPADLDGNKINYGGPGLSEKGVDHSRLVPENSVLMVCIGATLGKVNKTTRSVCFNQQINSLNPFVKGVTGFVALALKASSFQELAWSKAGTGTLPIISKGKWEVLPVPLPPLAEQHRIVAKVDELMTLCDQLEANLATGDDTRRRLLDALLHGVLPARRSGGHLTKRKTHTPRAIRMAARD